MPQGGVYRPRKPRASPLYQCADRHMVQLRSEGRLQRLLEERVIEAGLANWEFTEIRSGLKQGERVVASLERAGVKAGARAIEEAKAAAAPGK